MGLGILVNPYMTDILIYSTGVEVMKRVFMIGAIGFDKMSDECLLQQMIHNIREAHRGVHIGVLSNKPGETAKLGVEAVPREDVKAMWEAVEDCDTVVWLQSEHAMNWWSFGLEIVLIRLAQWRKKAIHSYRPQGGPKGSGWLVRQAQRLFDQSEQKYNLVRAPDDQSQNTDQADDNANIPHPLLFVHRSRPDGLRLLQEEGIHMSQRPVAICLDRQTALSHIDEVATLSDTLIDEEVRLLFMPVDHIADMETANHILDRMKHAAPVIRKTYSAQEWVDILGDMQTVVTTYDAVQAMCDGLNVPCVGFHEHTEEFIIRQNQT